MTIRGYLFLTIIIGFGMLIYKISQYYFINQKEEINDKY